MSFRIMEATSQEAPLVHQLMRAAFEEYRDVLQPPSSAYAESVEDVVRAMGEGGAVLVWEGEVAVASARFRVEPDFLYVGRVAVLPSHRRRGIASAVMRWMEARALQLGLSRIEVGVRTSLPGNLSLFQHIGYEIVAVRDHPRGPDRVATLAKRLKT
jgi:ribosomal protein S18 acetylase RimI-like enzyme